MSSEQKPGDPADKAADGAFGGVQSHRAGYGDDKLARLTEWLRAHPTATLASGEGALLLGEIDRLRNELKTETETVQHLIGERTADREHWGAIEDSLDRAERILAALREPSERVQSIGYYATMNRPGTRPIAEAIRAAVAFAEQEVGQ